MYKIDFDKEVIVFIHIPKTGGTSFRKTLIEQFGLSHHFRVKEEKFDRLNLFGLDLLHELHRNARGGIKRLRSRLSGERIREFKDMSEEERRSIKMLCGHARYGSFPETGRHPLHVSLVRDPTDRLSSEYYFLRQKLEDRASRWALTPPLKAMAERNDLDGFVQALRRLPDRRLWNTQCQFLSRQQSFEATREKCEQICFLIATLEQMDRLYQELSAAAGIDEIAIERRNISRLRPERIELGDDARALVKEMYGEDQKLYDWLTAQGGLTGRALAAT